MTANANSPQPPPSPRPGRRATRSDELMSGVGKTVYHFGDEEAPAAAPELDFGSHHHGRQHSNLSSSRVPMILTGVVALGGVVALLWWMGQDASEVKEPSENANAPAVVADKGAQATAVPAGATGAGAANQGSAAPAEAAPQPTPNKGAQTASGAPKAQDKPATPDSKPDPKPDPKKAPKAKEAATPKDDAAGTKKNAAAKASETPKQSSTKKSTKKKSSTSKKSRPKSKKKSRPKSKAKVIKPKKRPSTGLDDLPDPD